MKTIRYWRFVYMRGDSVIATTEQPADNKTSAETIAHEWGTCMAFDSVVIFEASATSELVKRTRVIK